jgi:hypothetical protein
MSFDAFRRKLEAPSNNPNARNPNSSATGPDQFIEGTWLDLVKRNNLSWAKGKTEAQILSLRTDPDKSSEVEQLFRAENAEYLSKRGIQPNNTALYAAHHFGAKGALPFLRAAGNEPVENLLSQGTLEANPYLRGKTRDEVIAGWNARAEVQPTAVATTEPPPDEAPPPPVAKQQPTPSEAARMGLQNVRAMQAELDKVLAGTRAPPPGRMGLGVFRRGDGIPPPESRTPEWFAQNIPDPGLAEELAQMQQVIIANAQNFVAELEKQRGLATQNARTQQLDALREGIRGLPGRDDPAGGAP